MILILKLRLILLNSMSISFLEQKKKNKLLLPILGGIIIITLIIIWLGLAKRQPASSPPSPVSVKQNININWQVLKNPILDNLELFEVIQPLQGSYGRKNPFLPY